ncbi:MAG: group I truncated hemoglobin [Vulcanimicrobiaceae bacterium]
MYERLGGESRIATVVDEFVECILGDPRLHANPRFTEASRRISKAGLKHLLTELTCNATGGPQTYTGRSMGDSHRHLMVTAGEWETFMDDFRQTLDAHQIEGREREELMAILESSRAAIVVAPRD